MFDALPRWTGRRLPLAYSDRIALSCWLLHQPSVERHDLRKASCGISDGAPGGRLTHWSWVKSTGSRVRSPLPDGRVKPPTSLSATREQIQAKVQNSRLSEEMASSLAHEELPMQIEAQHLLKGALSRLAKFHKTCYNGFARVAQWIEHLFRKRRVGVRFPSWIQKGSPCGSPSLLRVAATPARCASRRRPKRSGRGRRRGPGPGSPPRAPRPR